MEIAHISASTLRLCPRCTAAGRQAPPARAPSVAAVDSGAVLASPRAVNTIRFGGLRTCKLLSSCYNEAVICKLLSS